MGGDFAPLECIKGVLKVTSELGSDVRMVLFGDEPVLRKIIVQEGGSVDEFTILVRSVMLWSIEKLFSNPECEKKLT